MEKVKRDSSQGRTRTLFIAVWMIGLFMTSLIASNLTAYLLSAVAINTGVSQGLNLTLLSNALGLLTSAFVHVFTVERILKRPMRGWMLYTIAGLVTTWVLYMGFQSPIGMDLLGRVVASLSESAQFTFSMFLGVLISSLPALVFQGFWLRRRTGSAWLWPMIGLVIGLVSSGLSQFIFLNFPSDVYIFLLPRVMFPVTLVSWFISGLTMYHLMAHSAETQKIKREYSEADVSLSEERLRLQEAGEEIPYADEGQQKQRGLS